MTAPAPHHDGSPLHVDTRTPRLGDSVRVRLRVPEAAAQPAAVHVRLVRDAEPHWIEAAPVGSAAGWRWWEAVVPVDNLRCGYRWALHADDGSVSWLNQAGPQRAEPRDADDFALLAHPAPPDWMSEAVAYQVFPDRFARSARADARSTPDWAMPAEWQDPVDPLLPGRSRQCYGGDLDGVAERLDHLAGLGVTLLYLTPFFPAASNHRYDASDFDRVDPLLGGDAALRRLVEAAHARGIRVIGDLTTNHTGDEHSWFRAARAREDAPERGFYFFSDADPEHYEGWLGIPTLPKLDWASPELQRRFATGEGSVVRRWLEPPYELDGWRIDVANMTGRFGADDRNAEVRGLIRDAVRAARPDGILLAESTNDATQDLQGDGWHGAMSYAPFTRPLWAWLSRPRIEPYTGPRGETVTRPWFFGEPVSRIPSATASELRDAITRFTAGVPWRVRLGCLNALDTHDTARFATHARSGTIPVAVGLSTTLPGIPMLFAGDEFGLTGADGELSRTPLPWDRLHEPEITERISLYRELIGLRRAHPALRTGGMRWLHADEASLAFVRETPEETVLIFAASAAAEARLAPWDLPGLGADAMPERLAARGEVACARAQDGSGIRIGATGPAFAAWRLPGVPVPGGPAVAG